MDMETVIECDELRVDIIVPGVDLPVSAQDEEMEDKAEDVSLAESEIIEVNGEEEMK